jgi:Polyketide cyclase / dehydrase and lipid transport
MQKLLFACSSLLLVSTIACMADDSVRSVDGRNGWKLVTKSGDVVIYSRLRSGSPLKEFRAIGEIDAPTTNVLAVIDDVPNYPKFMPYTQECRLLKSEGNSSVVYQRLSPKICCDRDYTLRVLRKSWAEGDGIAFLNTWTPVNELGPPEKKGVVRIKKCDGSWLLEPVGSGKTRAIYSVYADSAGAIPSFLANHASQIGIGKIFTAIRKQVKDPRYENMTAAALLGQPES